MDKLILDESKAIQIKEDLGITPEVPLPAVDMSPDPIVLPLESGEIINKDAVPVESGEVVPPVVETNAYASMINSEIKAKWDDIDNINSIIATISSNKPELLDKVSALQSLVDEDTIAVGTLQGILDSIDGKTSDLIDQGIINIESGE